MPSRKAILLSMIPGCIAIAALIDELLLPTVMLPWALIGSAVLGFGSLTSGFAALQAAGQAQAAPQLDFQDDEPGESASSQDRNELQQLKGSDEGAEESGAAAGGELGDGG